MMQLEDIVDVQYFAQLNEEEDHIVFHNVHVEHDMKDGTDERTKTMHNSTNANGEQIDIVIGNEKTEAEADQELKAHPQKPR